jgi:hypothetical protein
MPENLCPGTHWVQVVGKQGAIDCLVFAGLAETVPVVGQADADQQR